MAAGQADGGCAESEAGVIDCPPDFGNPDHCTLCRNRWLVAENERLSTALAGIEGEVAGLRVSEYFFRRRCDALESAIVRDLTTKEQRSFTGCCPLCAATQPS
jgi:hypothetical protein